MNSNLYRLVYCSRNRIPQDGSEGAAEIENILSRARTNNAREGVTGALLYNDGSFAQALEGDVSSVGRIFEKVQCDPRHSEVTVVESGPIENRSFPDWAMAFGGNSGREVLPVAEAAFGAAFAKSEGAGTQIMSMLQELIVQENDWILVNA